MLCLDYSHPAFADCAEPRIRSTGRVELRGLYPAGILPVMFVYGVLVAASEKVRGVAEKDNRQNNHKKRGSARTYGEGTTTRQLSGSDLLNDERRKSTVGEADTQQNNKRNDESSRCYRGRFPIGVLHPAVGSVCDEVAVNPPVGRQMSE